MEYLHQIPRINDGLMELIETDPVFSALGVNLNDFKWPYMGPGFPGLVRIVIGQQLSTAAAATIWKRFEAELPCVTPNAIMVLKDDEMRLLGMSHQKARYLRGLSEAVRGKAFDPMAMENLPDEEVYAAITALNGFGNWSAEMYLMFGLARPDIWPAGDLGIQEGLRIYLKKKKRPSAEETAKAGKHFAPHRTAASLLLWHLKALER